MNYDTKMQTLTTDFVRNYDDTVAIGEAADEIAKERSLGEASCSRTLIEKGLEGSRSIGRDRARASGHSITTDPALANAILAVLARPATAPVKHLRLHYQSPAVIGGEGYIGASIDVAYKLLECAGEIQVAYSLDRKSLVVSGGYVVRGKDGAQQTIDPGAPQAPTTVALHADVRGPGDIHVGYVEDKIAGEALGMGCYDGQTQKLGTVATLVGAGANPDKVKSYLASLILTRLGPLAVTLRNGAAARPEPEGSVQAEAEARRQAEAAKLAAAKLEQDRIRANIEDDERRTADAHARSAEIIAGQQAIMAARTAEQADYARKVREIEEANRKYQADMQAYRITLQQAADARAAWEKRVAACMAGDRSQCQ